MRCGSTSTHSATPPFIVIASGCAPPMPPSPAVSVIVPAQRPAEPAPRDLGEALVRALQDPLGADVDPRARRHLPVHRQPERLEPAELLPRRPFGHEVRVRDQHPRRPLVGAEHADRLARLHEQRLVVGERAKRRDDRVERLPRARRAPGAAVDDEIVRAARRPRGRGCSSASASPLPAASRGRSARSRTARATVTAALPICRSTAAGSSAGRRRARRPRRARG